MSKKIKVFLGLIEIAGYLQNLKSGFNNIGIEAEIITIHSHEFYKNKSNFLCKISHFLYDYFKKSHNHILKKIFYFLWKISFFPLFIYSILKFNTFIFFGGNTFFGYKELFILKLLKKKIIYVFLGSDARPPFINAVFVYKFKNDFQKLINFTYEKKNKIKIIEKYADEIISHHTISHFFTKKYIDFDYIGNPRETFNYDIEGDMSSSEKVVVLHAPSRPKIKGSNYFLEIINKLKSKGYKIEYKVLTNATNENVIQEIKNCDIVLDEIYADFPFGGIVAEAAMLRKPVILSGYNEFYIEKRTKYSCYCFPADIESNLIRLIEDKNYYNIIANESYEYFFKNFSKEKVAKRYYKIIINDISNIWYRNPFDDKYIFGYGLSKSKLKEVYEFIILEHGLGKLYLENKPELEEKIIKFMKKEDDA